MAIGYIDDSSLHDIADAIRGKGGSGTFLPSEMASAIDAISAGVIAGTFTCSTSTGTVQSVSIPYSGTGHPVMVAVYPVEGGYNPSGSLYNLVQRYVVTEFFAVKAVPTSSPTYTTSGTQNQAHVVSRYKSSTSSATSYSSGAVTTANFFSPTAPSASSSLCLRFSDDKTMKVFVAASSYGFHAGTTYAYVIQYSS